MQEYVEYHGRKLPIVNTYLKEDFTLFSEKPIGCPSDLLSLVGPYLSRLPIEVGMVVCMDEALRPINVALVGMGLTGYVDFSVRTITQVALMSDACYVTLIHNHPSRSYKTSDLRMSADDIKMTHSIAKACNLLNMYLYDSIVVSSLVEDKKVIPAYYSYRMKNITKIIKLNKEMREQLVPRWPNHYADFPTKEEADKYLGFDTAKQKDAPVLIAKSPKELEEHVLSYERYKRKSQEEKQKKINKEQDIEPEL